MGIIPVTCFCCEIRKKNNIFFGLKKKKKKRRFLSGAHKIKNQNLEDIFKGILAWPISTRNEKQNSWPSCSKLHEIVS